MATDNLKIVLDALWKGKGEVQKASKDLTGLEKGATASGMSLAKLGKFAMVGATVGMAALGAAAKITFDALNRGSEIELLESRFENLTESIGTTSSALLNDMKAASGGMVSQAKLVEGAVGLMQAKLAKSHDAVVRLSTVSTQLGWDMGVLAQTINNQSVLRLDNLGLAVEDVIPRFKELQATMGDKEAFTMALVEAGEASLELLGSEADTTAGKIKIMQATWEDAKDAFAQGVTVGMTSDIDTLVGNVDIATESLRELGEAWGEAAGGILGYLLVDARVSAAVNEQKISVSEGIKIYAGYVSGVLSAGQALDELAKAQGIVAIASTSAADAAAGLTGDIDRLGAEAINTAADMDVLSAAVMRAIDAGNRASANEQFALLSGGTGTGLTAGMLPNKQGYAANRVIDKIGDSLSKAGQKGEEAAGGVGSFTSAIDDSINQMYELAAATGDFFMQARRYKDGEFNPFESLLESADKYGANALQLANIGVGGGLFSQEEATKYLRRTALMHRADQLGQLIARGQIDAAGAVGQLDSLHKALYEGRIDVADEFFAGLPVQEQTDIESNLHLVTDAGWTEYTMIKDQIEANPPTVVLNVVNPGTEADREGFIRPPGGREE